MNYEPKVYKLEKNYVRMFALKIGYIMCWFYFLAEVASEITVNYVITSVLTYRPKNKTPYIIEDILGLLAATIIIVCILLWSKKYNKVYVRNSQGEFYLIKAGILKINNLINDKILFNELAEKEYETKPGYKKYKLEDITCIKVSKKYYLMRAKITDIDRHESYDKEFKLYKYYKGCEDFIDSIIPLDI